ncbi:MAG: AsmA family protein, partial [Flavobacterium sp.]
MKEYLKKGLKILQWTIGTIIVLFLLLLVLIQIPYVQNFAKEKAVRYIQDKIKTKVVVTKIDIGFPKKIIVEGVYFEDLKKDTLLSANKIVIDISMFQLFNNKIEINSADLEGITATINKDSLSVFNFDYIVKAFSSPDKQDPETTPMTFSLENINLDTIRLRYIDAFSKIDVSVKLKHLKSRIKTFDLEKMDFEVPKITVKGLNIKYNQSIAVPNNEDNSTTQTGYKLQLGRINLSEIAITSQDKSSQVSSTFYLKKGLVKFNNTD